MHTQTMDSSPTMLVCEEADRFSLQIVLFPKDNRLECRGQRSLLSISALPPPGLPGFLPGHFQLSFHLSLYIY